MTLLDKVLALFINNLAMSEGVQLIGMFEGKGTGINFSNWMSGLSVDDNFTMFTVMVVMFFNNFTHLLLAYYFEQIRPGDHGLARPWHFPLTDVLKRFAKPNLEVNDYEILTDPPAAADKASRTTFNIQDETSRCPFISKTRPTTRRPRSELALKTSPNTLNNSARKR
jgi:hypothetical protein